MPAQHKRAPLYPEIAAVIREALERKGWSIGELNARLGRHRSSPTGYQWVNGTSAPQTKGRVQLAKLLGIDQSQLVPRKGADVAAPVAASGVAPVVRNGRVPDPLSFAVNAEGMVHIRLDVTLPMERAQPLLRLLLDAHVVDAP